MRFLVCTIQGDETRGYLGVSGELRARGHEVAHLTVSRVAARRVRRSGYDVTCLLDAVAAVAPRDWEAEAARIERRYDLHTLRSVWQSDPACAGQDERACLERTVRHFVVVEELFDRLRPDVLVPDVGSETMRTVAHLVALDRGTTTLFLFYTIFPDPMRVYVDTPHAPIVAPHDVRELDAGERAEVEAFVREFIERDRPILAHRRAVVTGGKLRDFARHVAVKALRERDNEYLRPHRFATNVAVQRARGAAARSLYEDVGDRPFVYFPLHVTDDFKVKRVIPHCVDQAYLIEQVADALPHGTNVVLKEHPVSVGRNSLAFLRRLTRTPNVRLVDPHTSSHELIRRSRAVVVISSTVGLEALLHGRPVLTLGQPFYGGYGVTVDVDSFRELRDGVAEVLRFAPDREQTLRFLHAAMRSTYPGRPVSVDPGPENLRTLAGTIEAAAGDALAGRRRGAVPAAAAHAS